MTGQELEALIRAARLFLSPELIQECIPKAASEVNEDDETSAAAGGTEVSSPASEVDKISAASSSTTQNYAEDLRKEWYKGQTEYEDDEFFESVEISEIPDERQPLSAAVNPFLQLSEEEKRDALFILDLLERFLKADVTKQEIKFQTKARKSDFVGLTRHILSFQPDTE